MELIGIAVIAAVDVLIPAGLAAWLVVFNLRGRRAWRTEAMFWFFGVLALVLPLVCAILVIIGIPTYESSQVIPATLFSLPGSIVPMIATPLLSSAFFDDATWASTGYFVVMPLYVVGAALWQLLVIVAVRRLSQSARRPRAIASPPVSA